MKNFPRITFNSNIMGGRACIRDMRIPVSLILNLLANEMPIEEILSEYPDLERADVKQVLEYAAFLASEEVFTSEVVS